jgi:FtsP/CotA-like multicopper oxidase with cupredoxin domain
LISLTRRTVLGLIGGTAAIAALPGKGRSADAPRRLRAAPASAPLVGSRYPETAVWAYEGQVPGPVLRYRQGERLDIELHNDLDEATSLHWHGLRLPNAMDGVPGVTQPPVEPGGRFRYSFDLKDAGTFWYHPHANSSEQVGRGLAGALVVEERDAPAVDREELWVLDDWRLDDRAQPVAFGGMLHDAAHAGRIGNTVTLNGFIPEAWPVRSAERVRLRLVNVANARTFALRFEGHAPTVIATDGQPCTPHPAPDGRVVLPAGGRCDLLLDMSGAPGERFRLIDERYPRSAYELLTIAYGERQPMRTAALAAFAGLPDNPLARPDIAGAEPLELVLEGGAMGGMRMAALGGEPLPLRQLAQRGKVWALNGHVHGGPEDAPLFRLTRGRTYRLTLHNDTAFEHPMHLHGHHLRLLARDGRPVPVQTWHDTLLVAPGETVETAFVAEIPGTWMLHCHVLEHQEAGMMGTVEIA